MRIILASSSERRKQLLAQAGFAFSIVKSDFDEAEAMRSGRPPADIVLEAALGKARWIKAGADTLVIGADTVVWLDGKLYGKPKNAWDAEDMLSRLSGNTHTVYTGVSIILKTDAGETVRSFCDTADVKMMKLNRHEIQSYVSTGEPLGRAGSYTLAERGAMIIESITGNYTTVLGLPMHKLYLCLKDMNIKGIDMFN